MQQFLFSSLFLKTRRKLRGSFVNYFLFLFHYNYCDFIIFLVSFIKSVKYGLARSHYLPGLVAATSLYLEKASFKANLNQMIFGMSMYTGLFTSPFIGKTIASTLFSNVIRKINRYITCDEVDKKICNSFHVNDILLHLQRQNSMIGIGFLPTIIG